MHGVGAHKSVIDFLTVATTTSAQNNYDEERSASSSGKGSDDFILFNFDVSASHYSHLPSSVEEAMRVAATNNKLRMKVRGFHSGNVLIFDGTVGELKVIIRNGEFEAKLKREASSASAFRTRSYDAIVSACDGSSGSPVVIIHITDAEENSSSSTLSDVSRALDARPDACPFYHVTNGTYRDQALLSLLASKQGCHCVNGGDLTVSLVQAFKEASKIMKRSASNKVSHNVEVETEISIVEARTALQNVLDSVSTAVDTSVAMQGDDVSRRVATLRSGRADGLSQQMSLLTHAASIPQVLPSHPTHAPHLLSSPAMALPAMGTPVQVFHATQVYQPHPYAQPVYYPAPFPGQQPYGAVPYAGLPYPYPQDAALLEKLGKLQVSEKVTEKVTDVNDAPPAYNATQKKDFILRIDGITEKVGKPALREFAAAAGITKVDGVVDKFGVQRGKVKFIFPDESSAKMALDMLNGSKAEEMRKVFGSGASASYRG
jgi:hypothetical protein